MSWSLFRWTWLLEAPLYVGTAPAGSLNRCRLYVPARALWGALTAELAPRQAVTLPQYEQIGKALQEHARFTYLYPAEKDGVRWCAWLPRYERGNGLVWRREDRFDRRHDPTIEHFGCGSSIRGRLPRLIPRRTRPPKARCARRSA